MNHETRTDSDGPESPTVASSLSLISSDFTNSMLPSDFLERYDVKAMDIGKEVRVEVLNGKLTTNLLPLRTHFNLQNAN